MNKKPPPHYDVKGAVCGVETQRKFESEVKMDKWLKEAEKKGQKKDEFYDDLITSYKTLLVLERVYPDSDYDFTKFVVRHLTELYLNRKYGEMNNMEEN